MSIELISRAQAHAGALAVVDSHGRFTYQRLLDHSAALASHLLGDRMDLNEDRVAFLVPPGFGYVVAQWAIWRAGGIAVPLAVMHPPAEWEYVLEDSGAGMVVVAPEFLDRLKPLADARAIPIHLPGDDCELRAACLPELDSHRRAQILYTSGTTSRPKGVVTTHASIQAQTTALVSAWEWTPNDKILNVLPLHHIHGIINVLTCALWSGACCEFLTPFDAVGVWRRLAAGDLSLFMAVPTVYSKLLTAFAQADEAQQGSWAAGASSLRLMVSGSAALPVSTLERWQAITDQVLLERYGMTEIGMALSNPLHGPRRPGRVGVPLPNVEVRRVDEDGHLVAPETPGEIEVRGPAVFHEYWNRREATESAFRDGWFRTGDVAVVEDGAYRILGRNSVDIIKTGGYKVSALEIEEILRTHPAVAECAVVGVPDEQWGEIVAACIVERAESSVLIDDLQAWTGDRLAPYKVPRDWVIAEELPRNAMGKVQKREILQRFDEASPPPDENVPHPD